MSKKLRQTPPTPPVPPPNMPINNALARAILSINEVTSAAFSSRMDLLRQMTSFDPRRDLSKECGYPSDLTPQQYKDQYLTDPYCARVVEVLSKESWATSPIVTETASDDVEKPFERALKDACDSLRDGSYYQNEEINPLWEWCERADIAAGIGHFSLVLIGLDDGKPLSEPGKFYEKEDEVTPTEDGTPAPEADETGSAGIGEEDDSEDDGNPLPKRTFAKNSQFLQKGSVLTKSKITYLRVFDESQVQVLELDKDPTSPRYGQPVRYNIRLQDVTQDTMQPASGVDMTVVEVHWSRVVHVPSDVYVGSEIYGSPRQRPVIKPLYNLQKIHGASGEGYYRGSFPGYSIESNPELGTDVDFDPEATKDQMEQYMNSLQRYMVNIGFQVKSLAPQVSAPTEQIDVEVTAICICIGCPKRVFMGSERGELASNQDDATFNDRLRNRQIKYIIPRIIVPLIDRLIRLGVLPQPESYTIKFPDLSAASASQQASIALTEAQVLQTLVQGGVLETMIDPMSVYTKLLKWKREDAEATLESTKEHLGAMNPDMPEEEIVPGKKPPSPMPPGFDEDGRPLAPEDPSGAPPFGKKSKTNESLPTDNWREPPFSPLFDSDGLPTANYSPDQARDEKGRWTSGGGSSTDEATSPKETVPGEDFKKYPPANFHGQDTFGKYTYGSEQWSTGEWTPERQQLHEKIIANTMKNATPVDQPVAYIMGGGPASGKSHAVKGGGIEIPENVVHIDPDAIKAQIPEYQGMIAAGHTKTAAFYTHEESSAVSKMVQARSSQGGYNTLLDGTGDSGIDDLSKKIGVMRDAGQKVVAHYVTVDTDVAVSRSMARAAKTGREVPEHIIRETHAKVSRVVPEAVKRGLYDEFTLWDTNGGGVRKVASAKGSDLTIHDMDAWTKFLQKGDEK